MTSAKTLLKWDAEGAADENAAALAWQEGCLSRALGEVKMFDDTDSPTYYGDIYSFLVRTVVVSDVMTRRAYSFLQSLRACKK